MTDKSSFKSLENKEKALFQLNAQVNERTKVLKNDFQDKIQEILACDNEKAGTKDLESDDYLEKYEEKVFEVDVKSSDPDLFGHLSKVKPRENPMESDLFGQLSKVKAKENLALIQEVEGLKERNKENEDVISKQKEQIKDLETELNNIALRIREKDGMIMKMQEKGKGISEESKKFVKEITIFNEKIEGVRKEKDELTERFDGMKQELERINRQKEDLLEDNERVNEELTKKDEKIKGMERSLEENKGKIKEKKMIENEEKENFNKENEKLVGEQKKLLRQKNELLAGFKKLRKLIEILQKQKTHLEVVGSLGFMEEEFIKALDLPEKMLG